MTATPPDGTVYLATDNRWYRWPDPAPYPSRDAAERQARPVSPVQAAALTRSPVPDLFAPQPFAPPSSPSAWAAAEPAEPSSISRAMMYVAFVLNVIPVIGGAIGFLTLPKENADGRCEGIGFGCVPAPNDSAFFLAVMALVVTVAATAFAAIVMTLWARGSDSFRASSPEFKAASILVPYAFIAVLVYANYSTR